jgi:hypothetical protein
MRAKRKTVSKAFNRNTTAQSIADVLGPGYTLPPILFETMMWITFNGKLMIFFLLQGQYSDQDMELIVRTSPKNSLLVSVKRGPRGSGIHREAL